MWFIEATFRNAVWISSVKDLNIVKVDCVPGGELMLAENPRLYVASTEIGKRFKFKDTVNENEKQALEVYHIKCKDCNADYIHKT